MSYYNERNGWTDNGKPLNPKNTKCPNCKGNNYVETLSLEYCPDCKMECNYWGGGSNAVYDAMCERKWAEDKEWFEADFRRKYGDDYDY